MVRLLRRDRKYKQKRRQKMRLRGWRKKVTTDKQLKELQSRENLQAVIKLHELESEYNLEREE